LPRARFLFAFAFGVLIGCQPATEEPTGQDARIAQTEAKVSNCAESRCTTLNIDRGALPDFAVLGGLDHMTALRASWTDFDDLADLALLTGLKELHVSSTQVADLSGLAAFPALEMLHVQWSRNITDFSPIGEVTTLTELALGGNDVGDMDFVANLTNLDGLSLTSATVSSMAALTGHPSLSRLDLEMATLPADIAALLTVPNLTVVSITPERMTEAQMIVVEALRAKGVRVDEIPEVVVVIC